MHPKNELESEGLLISFEFQRVVTLTTNQRVNGTDSTQDRFNFFFPIYLMEHHHVMTGNCCRTPNVCKDKNQFCDAIKLSSGNKQVAEDNFQALKNLNSPIAKVDALHS